MSFRNLLLLLLEFVLFFFNTNFCTWFNIHSLVRFLSTLAHGFLIWFYRFFLITFYCQSPPSHFFPPFQHLLSERLPPLGIMGEPRVPPLNPSETIVFSTNLFLLNAIERELFDGFGRGSHTWGWHSHCVLLNVLLNAHRIFTECFTERDLLNSLWIAFYWTRLRESFSTGLALGSHS